MEWLGESEIMKDLDSLSHMTRETPLNKIRSWTLDEPKPMFESGYEDDGDMDISESGYGPSWSKLFAGSGRGALHLKTYEHINKQAQRDLEIQAQVRLATSHNYSNETIEQSFREATLESPLPGQFDDDAAEDPSGEESSTESPLTESLPAVSSSTESPPTESPPAVPSSTESPPTESPPAVPSPAGQASGSGRKPRQLSLFAILKLNSIVADNVNANEKGRKVKQAAIKECIDDKLSDKVTTSWCKPQAAVKDSAQESSRNLSKTASSVNTAPSLSSTPLLKTVPSMKTAPLKTAPSIKTTPPEHHTAQDQKFLDSLKPAPPVYALEDRNQFPGLGGASRRK